MKPDVNTCLNKLVAYARDDLLLDALDETYTLNRLALLCGITPKKLDIEYDGTLDAVLAELKALVPALDRTAVLDIIMPLPHVVNYYFTDELARNKKKAYDFLFELYAQGGAISDKKGVSDGYAFYPAAKSTGGAVLLPVGGDELEYTPKGLASHVATLSCPDILTSDMTMRMAAYASEYKGVIVKDRKDGYYLCADGCALCTAPVKTSVKTGAVKVDLLDYPVPAVAVSGIAQNSVAREAARIVKAAADADVACVTACIPVNGVTFVVVFAKDIAADGLFVSPDALAACGTVATVDLTPLLPVLEKGVALSSDLFTFKELYAELGGVKHGEKAGAALAGVLAAKFKPLLQAAASATEEKALAFVTAEQT